jgi:hypothetical protein
LEFAQTLLSTSALLVVIIAREEGIGYEAEFLNQRDLSIRQFLLRVGYFLSIGRSADDFAFEFLLFDVAVDQFPLFVLEDGDLIGNGGDLRGLVCGLDL